MKAFDPRSKRFGTRVTTHHEHAEYVTAVYVYVA